MYSVSNRQTGIIQCKLWLCVTFLLKKSFDVDLNLKKNSLAQYMTKKKTTDFYFSFLQFTPADKNLSK